MKKIIDSASGVTEGALANGHAKTASVAPQQPQQVTSLVRQHSCTLTNQESRELEQSENIIKNGWKNFLQVGQALMKIQKSRLYRDGYATFEQYCRDRLEISRPYAYNLIGSAEVFEDLSSIEDISSIPANEAQTRYLICLAKENRIAAWRKAVEKAGGHPVTAKIVREIVVKYKQKKVNRAGSGNSAKKFVIDQLPLNPLLRLIDDVDAAIKAKDFSRAQKLLQQIREKFAIWKK